MSFVTFNIKVPRIRVGELGVLTFETVSALYGGDERVYEALKYFYIKGRGIVNPRGIKHGEEPDFDGRAGAFDEMLIRHSEQYLIAYLAHPPM